MSKPSSNPSKNLSHISQYLPQTCPKPFQKPPKTISKSSLVVMLGHLGGNLYCDASRISAGVQFGSFAAAGPNNAKHFQNLPLTCSKGPKPFQIPLQTPPKPSPASPKTSFGRDCPMQARSEGSRSDFWQFLALCAMLANCVPIQ